VLRILVVDGYRDTVESLRVLLSIWGHEARVIANAQDAFEEAASFRPHVVLLDLSRPGEEAFALARRLRQSPELADVFLLAAVGKADERKRQEIAQAGFDQHLSQPFDLEVLGSVLAWRAARINK